MFHDSKSALVEGGKAPGPKGPFRPIATITISALGHNGNLSAGRMIAPLVVIDMALGEAMIGVMAAMFTLLPIFGSVRFGRWVDRVGTLGPVGFTLAMNLVATGGMILFPGLPALVVASLLLGGAANFAHVAVSRALSSDDPARRRITFSRVTMGNSLSQFVTPTLAGIGYDLAGARGAFAVMALMSVVSLGVLLSGRHLLARGTARAAPRAAAPGRMLELILSPGVRRPLILSGMFGAVFVFFALAAALHGTAMGFSASQIGSSFGFMALGAFMSRLLAGWILRLSSERVLLASALAFGALVWSVVPFVESWLVFALASVVVGLAMGLGMPIATSQIYGAAPPARVNEAMGLAMAAANLFQLVTPVIMGVVAAAWGVGPMIWTFSAALLATAIVAATGPAGRH